MPSLSRCSLKMNANVVMQMANNIRWTGLCVGASVAVNLRRPFLSTIEAAPPAHDEQHNHALVLLDFLQSFRKA
jgi:hypothetical protein